MNTFTLRNMPTLDICVLGALEFLTNKKLPSIPKIEKRILVIGSGNALDTGKIIFQENDALYENQDTYKEKIKKINSAILISSSGAKHAPEMANTLKQKKVKTILLTNNQKAPASKFVSDTLVFPKQREPYTYNTSTYLSMILSSTKESPSKIYKEIKKIKTKKDFSKYKAFYIIVPSKFSFICEMFNTKFDELFGPEILGKAFTEEQIKHAKTVVSSKEELFVSLGVKNIYGKETQRLNIKLPRNSGYATIMSMGYYLIGKIQKQHKPFFKNNIKKYTKKASKIFKQKINPIIE